MKGKEGETMQDQNMAERALIERAASGDRQAMEALLEGAQDTVFNLSLRMLGTVPDAEDATQDILIRIMTKLSTFRFESAFSTWVYRLAVNYLIDYKKSMFAQHPLDFDFYANDLKAGYVEATEELCMGVSKDALSEELKLSCSNVMLQCLDPAARCVFILGAMFKADSRLAGEILQITPEAYRQRLSRARKRMAGFLTQHCGLAGADGCACERRVGYAITQRRISPERLEFSRLEPGSRATLLRCAENMEALEELADVFAQLPVYRSPVSAKAFLRKLLESPRIKEIQGL